MSDIFLPLIDGGPGTVGNERGGRTSTRIVIDPLTRIEGHLRIEANINNGKVSDAWSSSTMFRGIEPVMLGRDPRQAWKIAQRICGVCTTVHSIASVRTVENALGITVPDNARLIRNIIEAVQFIQDHVVHFYHLHALDWVDIVDALNADPEDTSSLARSISSWPNNSESYFESVQNKIRTFVNSGQLGIFANGYWGHPAYKLPPAGNLLAVAHYLEALDWQREYIKVHAILGGKNPHLQTYLVGGMATPINPNNQYAINPTKLAAVRDLLKKGLDFVSKVYLPDLKLIASFYKDWANYGKGVNNYLVFGDFPEDPNGSASSYYLPQGVVFNGNLAQKPEPLDEQQIFEFVKHSWYSYACGDDFGYHPSEGETTPNYTGPEAPYTHLNTGGKYSYLKAPRYKKQPMEVGPLARMVVAYAAGHTRVRQLTDSVLSALGVGPSALFSTLGRVAARGIETQVLAEHATAWLDQLEANINAGDLSIHNGEKWDPSTWPAQAVGFGTTEAPRGALGHWMSFANGKVDHFQAVVPTTWNGSPRDAANQRGPFEQSIIGTPIADPNRPLEILRTIHSFDPCMSCSVHLVDTHGHPTGASFQVSVA